MSGLIPISKFGFYSALGIMLQLLLLFYYLPTLLHFYPSHKIAAQGTLNIEANSPMQKIWQVWGGFMIRNSIFVSLVCVAVMIFFGLGMLQIKTSVKMMRFFSSDSEIIHHYTWLEEHLGPLVPMEVVVKFDNEQCSSMITLNRLRLIEKICGVLRSELGDTVGGIMSAETMMPPSPKAGWGATTVVRERGFNALLDGGRSQLRDFIAVEGNLSFHPGADRLKNLAQLDLSVEDADRLIGVGIDDVKKLAHIPADSELTGMSREELKIFREKAVQWEKNYGTDLWRISLRVWSLKKDIDYAHFIQDVKDVVEPIITAENEKLELDDSAIQAVYTGMVPVVYKTQHELHWGLQKSFVASFVLIGIAISFVLRSPIAGFLAMIPNLFPVFIVFGFMGHYGTLVDIGTMMTASVALGIATDDTIHFLTWFRHGIDLGMNRNEATRYAYSRSATAMFQTSVIAGLGLAAFALSTFTPTQMFGIMMLAILMIAMLGDLVFLAAMLNTPLGRFFEPRKEKS
jgi:predicted RND superfamily exporter protein